ncbi:metallophosphoesterase family protein [Spongiimicrobium salis]|uniref:metallophosphoesterase family protein n=1 Tax=Spongiimicrobium salis TaxID=1667022 RepID=UPI00374DF0D3
MSKKIAYVTDMHLDEEFPKSIGVDANKNWQIVLDDISSRGIQHIILGGDIGEKATNAWFFDHLKAHTIDISLGNHDDFHTVKKHYTQHLHPQRSALYYVQEFPSHRCIVLDSSTETIQEEQLSWLKKAVQTDKPIVVFVHHPILAVEVIMDRRYALHRRELIRNILSSIPNKVTIFCGHYHLEDEQKYKNIHQYITPACSYQVAKTQDEIQVNKDTFGYRILEFKEEGIQTELILF